MPQGPHDAEGPPGAALGHARPFGPPASFAEATPDASILSQYVQQRLRRRRATGLRADASIASLNALY
eukprot:9480826-Pyramimonas_sp.AAC.1